MILVRNKYVRDEDYDTEIDLSVCDRLVVAVADGMGGYEAGELTGLDDNIFLVIDDRIKVLGGQS